MVETAARTQGGRYPGEGTQCVGAAPSGVTACLSVCLDWLLLPWRIVSKADFPLAVPRKKTDPNNET